MTENWNEEQHKKVMNNFISTKESDKDYKAVYYFSSVMARKMKLCREKGRSAWENCSVDDLYYMLKKEIEKITPDPVDIANYAMMIFFNEP